MKIEKPAGLNKALMLLNDGWKIEVIRLPTGELRRYLTSKRYSSIYPIWEFEFSVLSHEGFIELQAEHYIGNSQILIWGKK